MHKSRDVYGDICNHGESNGEDNFRTKDTQGYYGDIGLIMENQLEHGIDTGVI